MTHSSKMFFQVGQQVAAHQIPAGFALDDLILKETTLSDLAAKSKSLTAPSAFIFVTLISDIEKISKELKSFWDQGFTFWIFYPKKPHLNTDLSRDVTWKELKKLGLQGTRQVAISDDWSCMYVKNTGKSDYVEIVPG
ncbi:MAG: hypothetical protein P8M68_06345 [Aquiluna sp.]|nr:hypothetical protein [Aquiluna sp.]